MNEVILIGRLTKDPELRKTATGKNVTNVTIAVDKPKKDADADFIRVQVWGNLAENLCKYMSKGRQIAVKGHISTGSYKKGEDTIYTTDIVADNVEFLGTGGGKKESREESKPPIEDSFDQIAEDIPF